MKSQRGTTAVEFAIIFPLILLPLLFGIIEFSFILYDQAMITNASREGARAGIVAQSPRVDIPTIQGVVDKYCKLYLISFKSGATPTTEVVRSGDTFGSDLYVTVKYKYSFLAVPKILMSWLWGDEIELKAISVMKME